MFLGKKSTIYISYADSVMELKEQIEERLGIPINRQILSHEGQLVHFGLAGPYLGKELELTVRPPERVGMGIGAGGNIIQHIEEDVNDPRIWDMASSKILNVQIINSIDFQAITGIPPPPTPIDAQTYADVGLPFYELYRDKPTSSISGAFGNVQTVGQIGKAEQGGQPPSSVSGQSAVHQQPLDDYQSQTGDLTRTLPQDLNIVMLDVDATLPRFKSVVDENVPDEDEEEEDGEGEGEEELQENEDGEKWFDADEIAH